MPAGVNRNYVKRETAQARGYSQAVTTEGGRTVWLAGVVAGEDSSGRSLAADFDGQVREVFARLGRTLEEAGRGLFATGEETRFITDARRRERFRQFRWRHLGQGFSGRAP